MLPSTYKAQLPSAFHPSSRVWVYQSPRVLHPDEARSLDVLLQAFVHSWKTHGTPVTGYGGLMYSQFIVLMADESDASVSGCSTDSSVHLIKEAGALFNLNFFDRQALAFLIDGTVSLIPLPQVAAAIQEGIITPDTIYFNNIVATKEAFDKEWMISVKDSWLARKFLSSILS